jgi:hypothetical protein
MIVQAIVTKFIGPTNTRGSRIKATAAAGSVTVAYEHALNIEANHARAAEALANKFKWRGTWAQGGAPGDSGYCFVNFDAAEPAFTTVGEG